MKVTKFKEQVREVIIKPKRDIKDIEYFYSRKEISLIKVLRFYLERYKSLKLQLGLQVLLGKYKNDEYIRIQPWFLSENSRPVFNKSAIKEKLRHGIKTIIGFFDGFLHLGSGWSLEKIVMLKLTVVRYNPLGGCFVSLPKMLANKRVFLNIRCDDGRCFVYCVLASLFPSSKNVNRPSNYQPYLGMLNLSSLTYPVALHQIPKFEEANHLSVSVYQLNHQTPVPVYISANYKSAEKHINLLLYKQHYILIRNLDSFLTSYLWKNRRKHYFCPRCLATFLDKDKYFQHVANDCHPGPMYKLPKRGTFMKFSNFHKQIKAPFVIYADFEATLKPFNRRQGKSIQKSVHLANAFCAIRISKFDQFSTRPRFYLGDNVIKYFLRYLRHEKAKIAYILEKKRKALYLTVEDKLRLEKQTSCYLCGMSFDAVTKKVRDHQHLGREGRGRDVNYACNRCNLKYSSLSMQTLKIPVIIHNLSNYDSHLILSEIYKYTRSSIRVIPKNSEKYLSFFLDSFVFIDSYQFLNTSLSKLANLLASEDPQEFKQTTAYIKNQKLLPFALRKGIMCYDYIDNLDRLKETSLPPQRKFFNSLTNEHISLTDYLYAKKMFKAFGCKNLGEYLTLYLQIDTMILCDVFESFREKSLTNYKLDPVHYFSAPSLSFDAMLKMTGIKLELLPDLEMHGFIEKGIRGGVTNVVQRYAKANNSELSSFDRARPQSSIMYLDCNNLYGYAMMQFLPYKGFRWLSPKEIDNFDVQNVAVNSKLGYILQVDLQYPFELHDAHNMLPLAPEKMKIQYNDLSPFVRNVVDLLKIKVSDKILKLVPNLRDKSNYILHYRNLQFYLQKGMHLTNIHKILCFKQKPWMRRYIDFNTQKRQLAASTFDRNFFKLMTNAVYGKSLENQKKRIDFRLVSDSKRCQTLLNKPHFHSIKIFNSNLIGVQMRRPVINLDKPIYVGFAVLDLSKLHNFHYNCILKAFDQNSVRLLYMDTDSFIYHITCDDLIQPLTPFLGKFDFSNLDETHPRFTRKNALIPGKFKDETGGKPIQEFIGLRSKMYSLLYDSGKEIKRAKGIKSVGLQHVHHQDYVISLINANELRVTFHAIKSEKHRLFTEKQAKLGLSPYDDKRWVYHDGIQTFAYGHRRTLKRKWSEQD